MCIVAVANRLGNWLLVWGLRHRMQAVNKILQKFRKCPNDASTTDHLRQFKISNTHSTLTSFQFILAAQINKIHKTL